mmetsp:Transcript_33342/g.93548  ORF Transcript_33342/g.93548 Transcript_33342/m.93548 type:complete len:233 (+) Transcript_33342:982-1680(+)
MAFCSEALSFFSSSRLCSTSARSASNFFLSFSARWMSCSAASRSSFSCVISSWRAFSSRAWLLLATSFSLSSDDMLSTLSSSCLHLTCRPSRSVSAELSSSLTVSSSPCSRFALSSLDFTRASRSSISARRSSISCLSFLLRFSDSREPLSVSSSWAVRESTSALSLETMSSALLLSCCSSLIWSWRALLACSAFLHCLSRALFLAARSSLCSRSSSLVPLSLPSSDCSFFS